MILKIKDEFYKGWFLRDDIAEVHYDFTTVDKLISPSDRHFSSKEENVNCVQILVKFKDGTNEVWVTQVTTFLLNDEGKTIERIN